VSRAVPAKGVVVSQRSRLAIFLIVAALIGAACGQKSGVAGTEVSTGGGGGGGGGEPSDGGDGGGGGTHEPGPEDTSGVTDDEIVIGVHAPVTGASPIPQQSFDIGKDIYWQFLAQSDPEALGGRKVRVVFRDDEFNPNRAVQVCREMVEQENAFVLVGGGGADQITACAQYAADAGVPYFSAGVNEDGLEDLATYYALSLTYAQQAPLIVARIEDLGFEKVGVVVTDTPSFQDAHDAFVKAAEDAELDIVADDTINKNASEAEAGAEVQTLKSADAEIVFILSSPLVYLAIAGGARNQNYEPAFIGPGITSGLNQVMEFGCPSVGKGQFFSPFPELDVIGELDPDYLPAYEQFGQGEEPDDIGIALWGLNKGIRLMFDDTGDELGRAALMNAIEEGKTIDTGVYPPAEYSPDEHFGGTGAHLLEADCGAQEYVTEEQFVEASGGE
jgi:ABC-type branched-subunit amino acid transport system substrate-binding protein